MATMSHFDLNLPRLTTNGTILCLRFVTFCQAGPICVHINDITTFWELRSFKKRTLNTRHLNTYILQYESVCIYVCVYLTLRKIAFSMSQKWPKTGH